MHDGKYIWAIEKHDQIYLANGNAGSWYSTVLNIMGNILTNRRTGSYGANHKFLLLVFFVS